MKMLPNEEYFAGKSVVIVGPSQSLKGSKQGEFIDSFDLVVRVNKGWWPATVFDKEEQDTIAEVLYEDCFHEDYETFELFQKDGFNYSSAGSLREDIGTRTDVLYNNYDRNMVSGGLHHPAIISKAGVKLLIGSRYPRDNYDWDDYQKLARDHTMIGSNGIGLVRKELYEAIVRQLGTTPHAGHSAILDLLYGNGRYLKSLHIMGFSYYSEPPAKEYYMAHSSYEFVMNELNEDGTGKDCNGDESKYGHDNNSEVEDIARVVQRETEIGRVTIDQLLTDRINGVSVSS